MSSNLHLATHIYSDLRVIEAARMCLNAGNVFRRVLSHWRHFLRDRKACLEFSVDQANGTKMAEAFNESWDLMADIGELEMMGMEVASVISDNKFQKMTLEEADEDPWLT